MLSGVAGDFGKTKLMNTIATSAAAKGKKVGVFTPEHKQLQEPYEETHYLLQPVKRAASKTAGTIRTTTGGLVDFWTLTDNELAGRGREYDIVLGDEAAFTKNGQMMGIWQKSIKPTMLTTAGTAWFFSTPNGDDPSNFFFEICNNPELGFKEFHAPTSSNPYVPPDELEKERLSNHPLVFQQEFLAEFVDFTGVKFFDLQLMLDNGEPVAMPSRCDFVVAVIDSATKTGQEHDGTAVIYFAVHLHPAPQLVILDYDIVQIEGALLETWLPTVFQNLDALAVETGTRSGVAGVWVEDKASGMVLLQQARNRGWRAFPINSALTSVGKDERAISVSGYVYRRMVKMSERAYNRIVTFKGYARNHLLTQVIGFKIGDKNQKRADDLADCFMYGIAITLGNAGGF
jgi:hypothetical protein